MTYHRLTYVEPVRYVATTTCVLLWLTSNLQLASPSDPTYLPATLLHTIYPHQQTRTPSTCNLRLLPRTPHATRPSHISTSHTSHLSFTPLSPPFTPLTPHTHSHLPVRPHTLPLSDLLECFMQRPPPLGRPQPGRPPPRTPRAPRLRTGAPPDSRARTRATTCTHAEHSTTVGTSVAAHGCVCQMPLEATTLIWDGSLITGQQMRQRQQQCWQAPRSSHVHLTAPIRGLPTRAEHQATPPACAPSQPPQRLRPHKHNFNSKNHSTHLPMRPQTWHPPAPGPPPVPLLLLPGPVPEPEPGVPP